MFCVFPGSEILGRNIEDAVGVDVESHLDLRHTTRRRRNPYQVKPAKGPIVLRHFALTLQDVHLDRSLILGSCREDLGLLGGNGRVPLDQLGEDTTQSLDSQRQRRDIE